MPPRRSHPEVSTPSTTSHRQNTPSFLTSAPRPETEASTLHLASVIFSSNPAARALHFSPTQPIRILDLCTGTGCISLLLFARLCRAFPSLHIHGVDISPRAVSLARENLRRSRLLVPPSPSPPSSCAPPTTGKSPHSQTPLTFERADIFSPAWLSALTTPLAPGTAATAATQPRHAPPPPGGPPGGVFDILVSNPPYISAAGFARSTERSVRNFEPKIALVPSAPPPSPAPPGDAESGSGPACRPEDAFYARLLAVADRVGARVLLFEVADLAQAMRVVHMLLARRGPRDARRPGEKGKGDLNALEKGGLGPADTSRDWMVEIWRDEPGARESEDDHQPLASVRVCNKPVRIRGQGEGRSVFAHRSSHS